MQTKNSLIIHCTSWHGINGGTIKLLPLATSISTAKCWRTTDTNCVNKYNHGRTRIVYAGEFIGYFDMAKGMDFARDFVQMNKDYLHDLADSVH